MQLQTLINFLEKIFPLELAEDWDNVGLTLGDRRQKVKKVLTCLTVDAAVADEAIELDADCIVSHHPFPFRAEKKWTSDDTAGELLLKLARAGIAVYSPHTAHDSAFFGVNRQLAEGLELVDVKPLYPGKLVATREMLDGLDPIVRKLVWKFLIDDVADRGMTVLVSSHNLKDMEEICDHYCKWPSELSRRSFPNSSPKLKTCSKSNASSRSATTTNSYAASRSDAAPPTTLSIRR